MASVPEDEPITVTIFMNCPDCKVSFVKPDDFVDHMEMAHGSNEESTVNEGSNNEGFGGNKRKNTVIEGSSHESSGDNKRKRLEKYSDKLLIEQYKLKQCSVRLTRIVLNASNKEENTVNAGLSLEGLNTVSDGSSDENNAIITDFNTVTVGSSESNSGINDFSIINYDGSVSSSESLTSFGISGEQENETNVCTICGKRLTDKYKLKHHIKVVHQKIKPFECPYDGCGMTFSSYSNRQRHVNTIHLNAKAKEHYCNHCEKKFASNSALVMHKQNAHQYDKKMCTLCDKSFCDQSGVNRHMKSAHHTEQYELIHLDSEHLSKKHDCGYCEKKFGNDSALEHHVQIAHPKIQNLVNVCPICGQSCFDQVALTQHVNQVHLVMKPQEPAQPELSLPVKIVNPDIELHECEYCNLQFDTTSNLHSHVESVHITHGCDQCGKQFVSAPGLERHIRNVHVKVNEKTCEKCNRKFADQSQLHRHYEDVHLQIKPYECQHCFKKFSRRSNLQEHVKKVHSKIKLYNCVHCGNHYNTMQAREQHIQIDHPHIYIENNMCTICGKTFVDQYVLSRHVKSVHYGIKPAFECEYCKKRFSTDSNLQVHINTKHPNMPGMESIENSENQSKENSLHPNFPKLEIIENSGNQSENIMDITITDFKVQPADVPVIDCLVESVAGTDKCNMCDQWFPDHAELNAHIQIVHMKK